MLLPDSPHQGETETSGVEETLGPAGWTVGWKVKYFPKIVLHLPLFLSVSFSLLSYMLCLQKL